MTEGTSACYWEAGLGPTSYPALAGDIDCDVVVLGGGYTGLASAAGLIARGRSVVILEARDIGFGASGRNGGSITPRFKMAFSALAGRFGEETACLLHGLLHAAIRGMKEDIRRYAIDCDYEEVGQITAAHSPAALETLAADIRWLRQTGDTSPRLLGEGETAERLGLDLYRGAYLDPRGARVQPLKYARGIAAALAGRGVAIYTRSPAVAIRVDAGRMLVATAEGPRVRARQVILATDAYLTPELEMRRLHRRLLTMASALITTAPLTGSVARLIDPGRHVAADTFTLLNYFQMLPGDRFLFGGRGKVTAHEDDAVVFEILERRMRMLFPALADVEVTHRWSGLVGLSRDNLPHAASLTDHVHAGFGFGGRGVVLSHVVGRALAALALGEPLGEFGPLAGVMPRGYLFHGLQRRMIGAGVKYYALRDRLAGRQPGRPRRR
jgi:gamma-glutamylputrescine oxidase